MRKQQIKRVIAGLFLTLFTLYYANATLFEHCHVVNGVTIVHSHIHAGSHHSTPEGGHTETNLTLIATLNHLICLDAGCALCGLAAYFVVCGLLRSLSVRAALSPTSGVCSLRAPPALQ